MYNNSSVPFDKNKSKILHLHEKLTHKARTARQILVSALYCKKMNDKSLQLNHSEKEVDIKLFNDSSLDSEKNLDEKYLEYICYYYNKFVFLDSFDKGKNGINIQNELEYKNIFLVATKNLQDVESLIAKYLKQDWTIERLNVMLSSLIVIAISEILFYIHKNPTSNIIIDKNQKSHYIVIISEYTRLAANIFTGKQISFVNAIIENILKNEEVNLRKLASSITLFQN